MSTTDGADATYIFGNDPPTYKALAEIALALGIPEDAGNPVAIVATVKALVQAYANEQEGYRELEAEVERLSDLEGIAENLGFCNEQLALAEVEIGRLRGLLRRAVQSEDERYRSPDSRQKRPRWIEDARAALEGEAGDTYKNSASHK